MAVSENISPREGPLSSAAQLAKPVKYKLPAIVVIYILTVVFPMFFRLGPLNLNTMRLLVLIMIIPLMINLFSGKYGKVYIFDYLFVLHLVWGAIALAVNNPSQVIEQMGSVGMDFLGGYMLARAYIRTPEAFIAVSKLLILLVIFLLLPLAMVENVTGRALGLEFIRSLPGFNTFAKVKPDPRMGFFRAQSLFVHPISYGLFCSVVLSMCLVGLKGQIPTMVRFVASSMILFASFTALSSGGLLAAFLQLGFFTWALVFRNNDKRWWLLFGLFVFAYILIDILSTRTPIEVFMTYATFSPHTAYWRSIIFEWGIANIVGSAEKGIPASMLFGLGLNDWVRPWYMVSSSVDNFWLVMAMRYGLPGFIILLIGYVIGVGKVMRQNFKDSPMLTQVRLAWVYPMLGLSFTLCTVHVHTNTYSFVFFIFGAGIWMIGAKDTSSATSSDPPEDTTPPDPERSRFTRFPKAGQPTSAVRKGPRYARD